MPLKFLRDIRLNAGTVTPPAPGTNVNVTSFSNGQKISGVVPTTVTVTGTSVVPSAVWMTIGRHRTNLVRQGTTFNYKGPDWDTKYIPSPGLTGTTLASSNYVPYIQAYATVSGTTYASPVIAPFTNNFTYFTSSGTPLPKTAPVWRSALSFAADYSNITNFLNSYTNPGGVVVGPSYMFIEKDPAKDRVRTRNVVRMTVPDSAWDDPDMPTENPRGQLQAPSIGREGDKMCVGFSVFIPTETSAATGARGFPDVGVSAPNADGSPGAGKHIAIFQEYGPQATTPNSYPTTKPIRGTTFSIDANRGVTSDPSGVFQIAANKLNPGDQGDLVNFSYNRGRWTDVVLEYGLSADVELGTVKVYLNDGTDGFTSVQPVTFFNGLTQVNRAILWPMNSTPPMPDIAEANDGRSGGSRNHRGDLQLYRTRGVYSEVTIYFAAHKVGQTVASVDPKSYA